MKCRSLVSAPGSKTSSILLKNPEGFRWKRKQEVEKNRHEQETVERVQRQKIRGLKARVRRERCISRGVKWAK